MRWFEIALVVLTLVTGLVWLLDKLVLARRRTARQGLLDDEESTRLARTLPSAESTVADVVVALDDLVCLPADPTVRDLTEAVERTGYSRFPIRGARGRLTGYLHVKDVLDLAGAGSCLFYTSPSPRDS